MRNYVGWARRFGKPWIPLCVGPSMIAAMEKVRSHICERFCLLDSADWRGSIVVLPEKVFPVPHEQERRAK